MDSKRDYHLRAMWYNLNIMAEESVKGSSIWRKALPWLPGVGITIFAVYVYPQLVDEGYFRKSPYWLPGLIVICLLCWLIPLLTHHRFARFVKLLEQILGLRTARIALVVVFLFIALALLKGGSVLFSKHKTHLKELQPDNHLQQTYNIESQQQPSQTQQQPDGHGEPNRPRASSPSAIPKVRLMIRRPEVILIFKTSPLFTEESKAKITKAVDDFRSYLIKIGFDIPKEVPPLGVAKGLLMSGSSPHSGPYNATMVIPEESLNNPSDSVIRAYAAYLFRELIPENPPNIQQARFSGEAVRLFADYYRCSFLGRRTVEYPPELDTWEATLWRIRQQHGQDFMDKSMFFAIKRWMPYGFDKQDADFDRYFSIRLEIGVAVFDNNGQPLNSIRDLLKEKIFGHNLSTINQLSGFITDGKSI